jgi:uncharacterized membrane protein YdbT with pleckstrin-like domain
MAFPRTLLNEGEDVVFELRPHWKVLVGSILLAPVIVGVSAFLLARVPEGDLQGPVRWGGFAIALLLLTVYCVAPLVRWLCTQYVVTDRRVILRSGVFSRVGRDLPMYRINDVRVHQQLVERMLRAGTLTLDTGGDIGSVELTDIPHVEHVRRELVALLHAEEDRRRGERAAPPPETDPRP